MNRRFLAYTVGIVITLSLLLLLPSYETSQAQIDPTRLEETILSIINPRLTLTAIEAEILTATRLYEITETAAANQTVTALAQTQTFTPSPTFTPSSTSTPTWTPVVLTDTPISATEQFQTLLAEVDHRFTQTGEAQLAETGTAGFLGTVEGIMFQTLGVTATASLTLTPSATPTSIFTPTPIGPTEQFQTLMADISQRVTETAAVQGTLALQQTIDSAIAATLGVTSTPVATHTPDLTEIQQTLRAVVEQNLTHTMEADIAQTGTAAFLGTVESIMFQTLGVTVTASLTPTPSATPTPIFTPTPVGPTEQFQTLMADINQRVTEAAAMQGTLALQQTIDSAIAATLGITLTPAATRTPNPTEIQQTLRAAVEQNLTRTLEAGIAQTGTAAFEATVSALLNQQLTATATAARATLVAGFAAISAANTERIQEILVVEGHTGTVTGVTFSADGTEFASASQDNTVRLWDSRTGAELTALRGFTDRLSVTLNRDGTRLASSSSDGTIRLWDTATGIEIAVLRGHTGPVNSVVFSPDGRLLASASSDRTVRLWEVATGNSLAVLRGHLSVAQVVTFSPDGTRLASGGQDAVIILWEAASGVQIATLRDIQRVSALAFSPDGMQLASGGNAGAIQLWETSTGNRGVIFRSQSRVINSLVFSPDGTLLVSGGQDGAIRLWDMATGENIATLEAHTGAVTSVAFSVDGVWLLSGGADQTIRLWGVTSR